MRICLNDIGKRFQNHWIFRRLEKTIPENTSLAITGNNGAGKSTLLKSISGITPINEGSIDYLINGSKIPNEDAYSSFSFVTPYMELIEELTLSELLHFHKSFKKINLSDAEFIERTNLQKTKNKLIRDYSSGMKQRVKLGISLFSNSKCLLLDEPTSNLDKQGIDWYLSEMHQILGEKTIIISSNMSHEYSFVDDEISVNDFKLKKQ